MADYTSIRQFASAVGIADKTMRGWLKRKDWPLQREAPWTDDDVAEARAWREATLRPDRSSPEYQGRTHAVEPPADDQSKDYWLMRKYRAQALEAEGELLAASDVRTAWVRTMVEVRQRLLLVAPAVASLCVGKGIAEIESAVDESVRTALDDIADRVGDLAASDGDHGSGDKGDSDAAAPEAE